MGKQRVPLLLLLALAATAAGAAEKANPLAQFSGALERLAATVAPAVVQVQVSAWCPPDSAKAENAGTLTSCRVVGSGVIVDPSGYIITNEHVVRNASRIRVMLTPRPEHSGEVPVPGRSQVLDAVITGANREPFGKREVLEAAVIGANRDADIALLKIEASGLPSIPLRPTAKGPSQGQVVLAVGSPEGLDNTMTIGVVSAVGRQPHPDFPMVYIQTDAAINPGNSGGPLLDLEGELVGINTFMITETGRNQGLGFAVPAAVARYVYEQLRAHGTVRQSLFGVRVQTVTPGLAQGLGLSRGYGVMICDVLPGSPADDAGLRPRDIITEVDGAPISALPYYAALMYLHDPSAPVAVTALRGKRALEFRVPAVAVDDQDFADTSIDPRDNLIPELGIFGKSLTLLVRRAAVRSETGVYVLATTSVGEGFPAGLAPGDVIASLNGVPVLGVRELRAALHELAGGKPAVLQVERNGVYVYVERELEDPLPEPRVDSRGDVSKTHNQED